MTANQTKILKTALLDFALSKADYYESLDIKEPSYSEKFKNKIKELSQQKNKSSPISKRVTFILIAAVIAVMLVASASALVVGFGDYLVNIYEKYIEVKFNNGNGEGLTIKEIYAPTYVPTEYSKTNEHLYSTSYEAIWSNGKHTIILDQKAHTSFLLDNESVNYQTFELDGKTVYYYTKYNTSVYMWSFGEYIFTINAPADIPIDEIKMMISSMEITEK